MPTIRSRYLGDLRTEQTHVASGAVIITDAPIDNQGKGQAFSPTDSVCSALAACMFTLMGIAAQTHAIPFAGIEAEVDKFMSASPRKIQKIAIRIYGFDPGLTEHQQKILERAARTCPVSLSLHPDVEQDIRFEF
jgi:putative redox protein